MKLYRCPICGNVVEKIIDKNVPVVCCGKSMEELVANTTEAATEKHLPVVTVDGDLLNVKVGEVDHPMLPEHYITMIIVAFDKQTLRVDLSSEDQPKATFALNGYHGQVEVYEYCNLHGLWKIEINV